MNLVPPEARLDVFIRQGVLVPSGVYCCKGHLRGKHLESGVEIDKSSLPNQTSHVDEEEVAELLEQLRKATASSASRRRDFDSDSLSDEDMLCLTGLRRNQFQDLVSHATSIKATQLRTAHQAVGMLLMKLRMGLSLRDVATLCSLETRFQAARIVQSAKKALLEGFVPLHLGFDHISRENVINEHSTDYAIQLFSSWISDSVILILDGTYIYIQKSNKHTFQRRCFSMHKHRPLVKPMMITTTDGYIVNVVGPYFADGKNNDAAITIHMVKTNSDNMMEWLREGDIFIVDRGFRDSLAFLGECGFQTESPAFLDRTSKQFQTEEANTARLVTKIRWAVESANGRVKRWRYFEKVVPNVDIPNIQDFLRIVAAITNKYRPPLKTNSIADCEMASKMLALAKQPNVVQARVESQPALKHGTSIWTRIDEIDVIPNWPVLSEEDIRTLTLGVYQVKQASHYMDEYLREDSRSIFISEVDSDLIHARIQSRHTASKKT